MNVKITKRDLWLTAVLIALFSAMIAAVIYAQNRLLTINAAPSGVPAAQGAGSAPARPAPGEPGFDVIRVTRDGRAVMAGRALPGAHVTVSAGGNIIGETTAGRRGDWVLIPQLPLAPGAQVLTLTTKLGDGGQLESRDSAIISVPARPDGDVFVAVSRPGAPTRIMEQGLGTVRTVTAGAGAAAPHNGVQVAGIDIDPSGRAILSGHAVADRRVRLYMNDLLIGDALAGADGFWSFPYAREVPPGAHILRADQISENGRVAFRAEAAFVRHPGGKLALGERQIVVQQGNRLWEIARNVYGAGVAYSIIFTSNQGQIRDPDLIYPGQVFRLPPAKKPAEALEK